MSCLCAQCQSLGCSDEVNRSRTTRSTDNIERHGEKHREQILLIDRLGKLENNGTMEGNGVDKGSKKSKSTVKSMKTANHIVKRSTRKSPVMPTRRIKTELLVDERQETKNQEWWDSFVTHCRSILPKRRPDTGAFARCSLCKSEKAIYSKIGTVKHHHVFDHVLMHLGHKVYLCRLCEFKSNNHTIVKNHLETVHSIAPKSIAANFEDNAGQYAKEIEGLIAKCFGNQKVLKKTAESSKLRRKASTKSISRTSNVSANPARSGPSNIGSSRGLRVRKAAVKRESGVTRPALTDKLAKIRQDLCWRLIRDAGNPDRIRCKKCGDNVLVTSISNRFIGPTLLRQHIQLGKHLSRPLYGCHLCHTDHNSYSSLNGHFRSKHPGVSLTNNYENRENDYHDEIMRELSACFGKGDETMDSSSK